MKSDKIYPDTGVGAISFLKDNSTINLEGAITSPDHKLKGVWLVEHRADPNTSMSIVYLKNHKDRTGSFRENNTFESL